MPLDMCEPTTEALADAKRFSAARGFLPRVLAARICALRTHQFVEFFQSYQDISRLRSIGGSEDSGELQLIDDSRRPAVSDTHPALQEGCRSKLVLDAYLGRLPEQRIALARLPVSRPAAPIPFFLSL